eukprot:403374581
MRSLSCCGKKQPKTIQGTRLQLEQKYGKVWRFKDDELFEFTKRFESQAVNHKLSHKNYRESLGIIGIESLSFMCDRMFKVMDKDKDGYITLEEYLNYTDALLYGTEDEKLKQSFELLDEHGRGRITFHEFRKIVGSFAQMWSAALAKPMPINPRFIARIFQMLSQDKEYFDLNDFMRAMKVHPDMLFWFSKPEEAMNKRLNEHLGKQEQKEQKLREKIETMRDKFAQYHNQLQIKLQQVIEVISGVVTPQASKDASFYSTMEVNDQLNNNFQTNMNTSINNNQVGLIQKTRVKKIPVDNLSSNNVANDLFMNLDTQHKNTLIEFPRDVFNSKSPKSSRINNNKNLRKMQTKITINQRNHHQMRLSSNNLHQNQTVHQKKKSLNQILSHNNMRDFDVIVEESPKIYNGTEDMHDSHHNLFNNDKLNSQSKSRFNHTGTKSKFDSVPPQNVAARDKKYQFNQSQPTVMFEKNQGMLVIPNHIRVSDLSDQQFQFPNEDKADSSMFDRDSQSNMRDDYMFEGGSDEEEDDQLIRQNKSIQPTINQQARFQSAQNSANRTVNENDIEVNLSRFDETRSVNMALDALQDIHLQSNPNYPGQIFYVDSPLQLQLIQSELMNGEEQNEKGINSSDSSEDLESSSDSEHDGPDDEQREVFEENIQLKNLDPKERELIKKIRQMQKYLENINRKPSFSEMNQPTGRSQLKSNNLPFIPQKRTDNQAPVGPSQRQSQLNIKNTSQINGESIMTFAQQDMNMLLTENTQLHLSTVQPSNPIRLGQMKHTPTIMVEQEDSEQINTQVPQPNLRQAKENFKRYHTQNEEKIHYRINLGKKILHSLIKQIQETQENFDNNFKSMLVVDNDENHDVQIMLQNQVRQNIPKTLIRKRNKILKGQKERSNIPDNVKLIHPAHENFNLVFNIMLGIKKAIDSTLDIPMLEPTEKDFKIKCKHELVPFRTQAKDDIKACTFYDYAPQIFANIRKTCGIKKAQYSNSLGPEHILGYMFNANFQTLAELCSSGKSGSFFYYTSDGKFVLKTISRNEFKLLKRILRSYHDYLTIENNESIISKVLGLHKVIFYHKRYDLKGSTQGRNTLNQNQGENDGDPTIALKDLDFTRFNEKFKIEGSIKKRLLETIQKDAQFFARNAIIDYSLLVGVHYKSRHPSPTNGSRLNSEQSEFSSPLHTHTQSQGNGFYFSSYDRNSASSIVQHNHPPLSEMCEQGITSIEKSCIYFIGIIDILTEYNTIKKLEHALKSVKYDSRTISCIPPQQYADRFIGFMKDATNKINSADQRLDTLLMQSVGQQDLESLPTNNYSSEDKKIPVNFNLQKTRSGGLSIEENNSLNNSECFSKFDLQETEGPLFRPQFDNDAEKDDKNSKGCSQAVAYSMRDRMIECFNDTNQYYLHNDVKRVYFMSMEYIFGRLMQINLLNNDIEQKYKEALQDIGYDLHDLYEEEIDINLGYGVLGRIAADSIDSLCSKNIPCWAYGLRYDYGIFRQDVIDFEQVERPDYWLEKGNPWEIERPEQVYKIRMYGNIKKEKVLDPISKQMIEKSTWENGEVMLSTAYDMPVTGYNTFNTNNLRLWRSRPYDQYEESMYGEDPDYYKSVEKLQESEYITSIFYPNDKVQGGKELRLKQQYFYIASTLQDIFRRFNKISSHKFDQFEFKNAIYLHETHSAIAMLEMLRLLIDEYSQPWLDAWNITYRTFSCGFYNIKESQMEKWPVEMFARLLPRHMELIYLINHLFIEKVKKFFPQHEHETRLKRMSIIEESNPKQIRMANICLISCHKVVLCSELQFKILTTEVFKDFYDFLPKTFVLIENGANPRRWIHNCNRSLSKLITEEIKDESEWLMDLNLLSPFAGYIDDLEFFDKFLNVRAENKMRLLNWIKKKSSFDDFILKLKQADVKDILFDIMVKRVDENKRQLMYLLYIIYRYNHIKTLKDKSKVVTRFHLIGGKTAIGNTRSKSIVKLINQVAFKINSDLETNKLLRVIFIPNYNASKEHLVVPAADFNQQISLPGVEACTTISEKFLLNGALILGSRDATNTTVMKYIGAENITLFGPTYEEAQQLSKHTSNEIRRGMICEEFKQVTDIILSGEFGDCDSHIRDILTGICQGNDHQLVGVDFKAYIQAQEEVDIVFQNKSEFCKRTMITMSQLGNLSIDSTIEKLCEQVWRINPVDVPKPSQTAGQRVVSSNNLLGCGSQEELNRSRGGSSGNLDEDVSNNSNDQYS